MESISDDIIITITTRLITVRLVIIKWGIDGENASINNWMINDHKWWKLDDVLAELGCY